MLVLECVHRDIRIDRIPQDTDRSCCQLQLGVRLDDSLQTNKRRLSIIPLAAGQCFCCIQLDADDWYCFCL